MSEKCMCPPEAGSSKCELSSAPEAVACPPCGQKGKPVDILTVKAMLAVPLTEIRSSDYQFCKTPDCPVVYFSTDGKQKFFEENLREKVHQKHPSDDRVPVCYCFKHTPQSITEEILRTGKSAVIESITAGIKAGQCACEIRNPEGSCCLGNVRAVVKQTTQDTREEVNLRL